MNWDVTVKADVEWFRILTRCKLQGLISPWPSLVVPVVLFADVQIPKTYWWVLELKVIWRTILIKIITGTDNLDAKSQYCLTRARIQASLRRILSLITHKTVNVRHIKIMCTHIFLKMLFYSPMFTIEPVASVWQDTDSNCGLLPMIPQCSEHFDNPGHDLDVKNHETLWADLRSNRLVKILRARNSHLSGHGAKAIWLACACQCNI